MKPDSELLEKLAHAKELKEQAGLVTHFYVTEAAVCVQCQAVYKPNGDCPACGSPVRVPLTRFVPVAVSECEPVTVTVANGWQDWQDQYADALERIR